MSSKRPGSGIRSQLPEYEAVSFNIEAFDQALMVHGVQMVHFRAMRCPVGMTTMYDSRQPHQDHAACSNGFIYKKAGIVTTVIMSNGKTQNVIDVGVIDNSTVQGIFPVHYDRGLNDQSPPKECHIAPFDRLYMLDDALTVIHWQLFESSQTGHERLHFPVVDIEHLVDSSGHEYGAEDYDIDHNGQIVWKAGQRRPGFDPMTSKGDICSIRFKYRPYWYVDHLLHEIRVARAEDHMGDRVAFRMPYAAQLTRERFFENEKKDDASELPNSLRQVVGPASGNFGPR